MVRGVLELEQVKKSYPESPGRRLEVLDIEHFSLAFGEQIALEGRSGSGKSTLLHVLSGITSPDSGRVILDGIELGKLSEAHRDRVRADKLGMVFQSFNLLPGFTALENVLVAMSFGSGKADRRRAIDLLSAVGLEHRLSHRPAALSMGEQQRVAVARAIANRPRVVLADEPTASVDPSNQRTVVELLKKTCRDHGSALLIVTHSPEVASQFEVRVRIEDFNRVFARSMAASIATNIE